MRLGHALLLSTLLVGACSQAEGPLDGEGPQYPSVQVVDSVRYSAETAFLESYPLQLRTTVTVTNIAARADTVEVPGGCPVLLRAYRDAGRAGPPAWDQARVLVCTLQLRLLTLSPGEAVELEGRATATDILGDSLPARRYYLTAVVRADQKEIELAAGSVALSR